MTIRSPQQIKIDNTIHSILNRVIESCRNNDYYKRLWKEEKEKEELQKLLRSIGACTVPEVKCCSQSTSLQPATVNKELPDKIADDGESSKKIAGDEKGINLSFDSLYFEVMSNVHLKNLFTARENTLLRSFHKLIPAYKSFCLHLFIRRNMWMNASYLAKTVNCRLNDQKVDELSEQLHADGILLKGIKFEAESLNFINFIHNLMQDTH